MEKLARKPSTDPVQEKLRQNKTNWNKEVSSFINDLIHLKKTMNGWPSKFHKERSKIVEPIPADPATIIGSLAGDFQDIVTKGNSLIQEQLNYSKNRRQKQPKQLNLPFPPPGSSTQAPPTTTTQPNLSQQLELGLASDNNDYQLISNASNPLTRFFARLLNPSIGGSEGARVRRYRKSLLNASAQMYKDLKKLQDAIVSSGPQSIFLASKLLDKTENNWVFLASGYKTYIETLPNGASDTGDKIETPKELLDLSNQSKISDPKIDQALIAVQDIQKHSNNFSGVSGMPELREAAKKFYMAGPSEKLQLADSFLTNYQQILTRISNEKQLPVQDSLANIAALELQNKKTVISSNEQMQIVAQTFLKKLRHQLSPFDKTSSFRLDVYNMAEENKKLLDKVMDILEAGFNQEELSNLLGQISDNMKRIRTLMQGLTSTIRGLGYQPEFLNLLERGRVGDYGVPLNQKQKSELGKMLELKQMRELVKMYGGK